MKKILRVCHKYLKDNDGYDLGIQDLALTTSPFLKTYIICFISKQELPTYLSSNNLIKKEGLFYHKLTKSFIIPIIYEKTHGNYIKDLYLKKNIKTFKKQFKKIFSLINPEIVHIHGTLVPQFITAAIHTRLNKKKVYITHHTGLINKYPQKKSILLKKFLHHNILPLISNKTISYSIQGKNSFLLKSKIEHFYGIGNIQLNPLPKVELEKLISQKNLLKLKFNFNNPTLLYPARYCKQKNQEILIEVFNKLKKEKSNITLILAGQISDKSYFKKLINKIKALNLKNIFLLSEIDHKTLLQIMKNSSFVIYTSKNEAIGRAGLEALSLETPVIAPKDSGLGSYIIHGKNGFLINLSENSITKTIKHAIKNKKSLSPTLNQDSYINKLKKLYEIEE